MESLCHIRNSVRCVGALDLLLHLVKGELGLEQTAYDEKENKMEESCATINEFLTNSCPHCGETGVIA